MSDRLHRVTAALLRRLDPETAHRAALALLKHAPIQAPKPDPASLAVDAFGLRFANPIGLAAGFDKDAEGVDGALRLGFGFTEVGTLTPRPQGGNPRPRVFRSIPDQAVVNRYGFNNAGHVAGHRHLAKARRGCGIVGVNIGANKDAPDRVADYSAGIVRFADVADYFALNVSSPNTPGLRDLQAADALDRLLARTLAQRDAMVAHHGRKPLLLKIAPDLDLSGLDDVVRVARRHGIDGLIVSNTTTTRPVSEPGAKFALEAGGLSGRPLFDLSTRMLAETFVRVEGQFPLVGVGGIDSPQTALAKIRAGATLLQLYSGLVFTGTGLVSAIKTALDEHLRRTGSTLDREVGAEAARWRL